MMKIRCVFVGDEEVGKSSVLMKYTSNHLPSEKINNGIDNYSINLSQNNTFLNLQITDVSGSKDYSKIRPLAYSDSDLFVICFSVDSQSSYDSVLSKWVTEVILSSPNCKIILLATKKDLREDPDTLRRLKKEGRKPISFEKGVSLAKKIKAERYMECSVKDSSSLSALFEYIAQCFSGQKKKKSEEQQRVSFSSNKY